MHDITHKLAVGLLAAAALAALAAAWTLDGPAGLAAAHRQWILVGLAASLLAALAWPALRLPAIGAALLVQVAYLAAAVLVQGVEPASASLAPEVAQSLLLLAAGWLFLHEARQEARWDGVLPLRQEG
ncbi:hypothetical protein FN976_26810 [Caenimonas sedimenti]|uniref:DUF4345 domain-containing protein n=1 Tax=Caenimonas sedimenti TaxID=2596921 RepID=A0A562ZFD2_9BURK|nr:hypothetical protein [Caenimonas sedimenti]TWO66155.1 hypothetical protein FN976_26810 [Caenimonas sedimenti]